ncbi:MAG: hypothetical protein H0U76_09195 [Ktedonobacteraceae bacterium]|nr:hypothetical protein [Ktedonobacteraceae bacterium]
MPNKQRSSREPVPVSTTDHEKAELSGGGRKPWKKKTPVEVMLDQIRKQEERVVQMEKELALERRELEKLQQARAVLEAT